VTVREEVLAAIRYNHYKKEIQGYLTTLAEVGSIAVQRVPLCVLAVVAR